ncbi:Uncharacterised protein [Mycobacteroides abscessus subsp. abscessus]|nr:Uncharacterised protein [Mycobacteroides abscessus subsp. abscessus]
MVEGSRDHGGSHQRYQVRIGIHVDRDLTALSGRRRVGSDGRHQRHRAGHRAHVGYHLGAAGYVGGGQQVSDERQRGNRQLVQADRTEVLEQYLGAEGGSLGLVRGRHSNVVVSHDNQRVLRGEPQQLGTIGQAGGVGQSHHGAVETDCRPTGRSKEFNH